MVLVWRIASTAYSAMEILYMEATKRPLEFEITQNIDITATHKIICELGVQI